jgi:hypothetical protein
MLNISSQIQIVHINAFSSSLRSNQRKRCEIEQKKSLPIMSTQPKAELAIKSLVKDHNSPIGLDCG